MVVFFFSSRRRHTRYWRDWSSDVCSSDLKASGDPNFDYNNSILYLISDVLPNGLLGVALAGLLAAFMAGMAANISAFNTVFSYDLWQQYVVKDRPEIGRASCRERV